MTSLFDKLNLRPGERRLVVFVGGVVFVMLNLWLVLPHFGDLGRVQQRTRDAKKKLDLFESEIRKEQSYRREKENLREQGAVVAADLRDLELQREVTSQALASGVVVQRYDSIQRSSATRTNAFFDEQSLVITVSTGEKELVDFLYNLAERNSLIRVRQMTLQPDRGRHSLMGNITFVASYQKKPPSRVAAAAPKPASPPPPAAPAPAESSSAAATGPAKAAPPRTDEAPLKPDAPPPPPAGQPARVRNVPVRLPPPSPPPQQ